MTERRNATILAADVVGYTAMMQADEELAFARVSAIIERISLAVAGAEGHVVDIAGDGLIAHFPSAPAALRAALHFQDLIAKASQTEPENQRVLCRVGLHLGEIVFSGEKVFGSVVNVAARLQNIAQPGGIVVSGPVHEAVRGSNNCGFEFLGTLDIRGVTERLRCFRVLDADAENPPAFPALPDKPSIAVLPFANLSADPEQEFFADGVVEDVINALSRIRFLFVIARGSSFTYRNRKVPVSQIGRELGVRYVLDGTVRRAGNRMRITGTLVEAETGIQHWASQFEGDVSDMFALQDRVTEGVAAVIEPRLLFAEVERVTRWPPESIQAYDLFLRATGHFYRMTRDDIEKALELTDRALRLDPNSARNLALGARCRCHRKVQGWVPPDHPTVAEAARMARRAAELAKDDSEVLWMAGIMVALAGGDMPGAIALIDRALEINPNSADALTYSGMVRGHFGDSEVALEHLERAHRLSPRDAQTYNKFLAAAFAAFNAGRYEESLGWTGRSLKEKPDYSPAWRMRAACFGLLDRIDEGKEAVLRLLALSPNETQASLRHYYNLTMKKPGAVDALVEGLRRVGMPAGDDLLPRSA